MPPPYQFFLLRTGIFGKWHLSSIKGNTYTYDSAVDTVKSCGFDTVGCLYVENLARNPRAFTNYADGTFSHNMECMTYDAINFIQKTDENTPFFMYFNPTVPHGANTIEDALNNFSCQDTPAGTLGFDPVIPGMTQEDDGTVLSCDGYRDSIFERANNNPDELGPIWLDDSVGALLKALEDKGILDNTIFLFQEDHGVETKGTIYETGLRIPQFLHYPNKISPGSAFEGVVSTVDIAPTLLDFADVAPKYEMDGLSWKDAINDSILQRKWQEERCLFFEHEQDRAVRCGCYKYVTLIGDRQVSTSFGRGGLQGLASDTEALFDLCDVNQEYKIDPNDNQETENLVSTMAEKASELSDTLACFKGKTAARRSIDSIRTCAPPPVIDFSPPPSPPNLMQATVSSITSTSAVIIIKTSDSVRVKVLYSPRRVFRRRIRKATKFVKTKAENGYARSIRIKELKPGKKYYYKIYMRDGDNANKKFTFKTLEAEEEAENIFGR